MANMFNSLTQIQVTFSRERERRSGVIASTPAYNALTAIQKVESTRLLRAPDLRDFLAYLGGEEMEDGWKVALLEGDVKLPLVEASERLQGEWIAWAAALATVAAKLRTPLGKAQETLGHIADAARKLASTPVNKLDQTRASLLLSYVRGLEKCMLNSWDGSVNALPQASKSTQLFFYANKATCLAWLGQVRGALLALAHHCGQHGEALRHASLLLPVLARRPGELEQNHSLGFCLTAALSMASLDSAHGLAGLQAWMREKSGQRLRWVPPLIELVRRQTETGVGSLQGLLHSSQLEEVVRPRLEVALGRSQQSVGDHQAYLDWLAEYRASRGESQTVKPQEQFLVALSRFQDGLIPTTVDSLEVSGLEVQVPLVEHLLDAMHLHLLQAGSALQSTYMRSSQSWGENDKLGWSLKEGANMASRLISCASTETDTRRSLLLNMIHQEVLFHRQIILKLISNAYFLSGYRSEGTVSNTIAPTFESRTKREQQRAVARDPPLGRVLPSVPQNLPRVLPAAAGAELGGREGGAQGEERWTFLPIPPSLPHWQTSQ